MLWSYKHENVVLIGGIDISPASKRVLDILPCRSQGELITYLKQWNAKERKRVKYFVSDMWQPYTDVASAFFKNSVQIVDRYHFIRQMVWAFEKVRIPKPPIEVQQEIAKEVLRIYETASANSSELARDIINKYLL